MAAAANLSLRALSADEYAAWRDEEIADYARDIAENGDTPPAAARRRAADDLERVLPDGLATPGHAIYVLEQDGAAVGRLWLAERLMDGRRALFIYDIHVDPAFRGRGLGRAAMLLAEDEARVRGIGRIELNVFGGNTVARRLYLSLGYVERAVLMAKDLS
jgi:ribosomal protein S18 acetylase RimI-like enzyme